MHHEASFKHLSLHATRARLKQIFFHEACADANRDYPNPHSLLLLRRKPLPSLSDLMHHTHGSDGAHWARNFA
jgi:hypothetical protein